MQLWWALLWLGRPWWALLWWALLWLGRPWSAQLWWALLWLGLPWSAQQWWRQQLSVLQHGDRHVRAMYEGA